MVRHRVYCTAAVGYFVAMAAMIAAWLKPHLCWAGIAGFGLLMVSGGIRAGIEWEDPRSHPGWGHARTLLIALGIFFGGGLIATAIFDGILVGLKLVAFFLVLAMVLAGSFAAGRSVRNV